MRRLPNVSMDENPSAPPSDMSDVLFSLRRRKKRGSDDGEPQKQLVCDYSPVRSEKSAGESAEPEI